MFALIQTLFARSCRPANAGAEAAAAGGLPHSLFEGAEARAGRSAQDAEALRVAASAYLRVVR